ncbi:unnamed protein product [Rotaria magnacalcarata]|uniref:Transposase Tc5 C-terminal domain-containing protein n=1 Tax=Rotaria magnacalcarata TaxID=392030 RepID=A0A8S2NXT4_9BILA|nr:unnamed protein product [Rotaria magnacalcarata]
MNLLNIAKHLLHLTQTGYGSENSAANTDEIFVAERLFEILKSFKDSYFNELYSYDTLEFEDEYDEMADAEESGEEMTDEEESDEEMKNIIEWVDEHPNARFVTISNRFRKIKSMNYITKFREYIENNGTRLEKLKRIKEFMSDEFYQKRAIEKEAVHDDDLELYAIQKARELNWDTFKTSKSFINTSKRGNGISSRRYNKIITRTKPNKNLFNLNDRNDHCSFQQEYVSPRTLSFTGERTTEVAIKKKHSLTHSYTVQPVTSADGHLLEKFFLILQEKENEFGKRVQTDLIVPPNVVVRASKSGKILRPLVGRKFLLFLDSWKTQADLTKFRAVFPNQDSQLLIFPEGSTGYIQPQDLSLFRSWRFIHEKIEHYTHINRIEMTITDRQYFINMHSVIHNQLSAPQFKNLIKSGFIQARITNETIGQIEKPKNVCFKFYDLDCSINSCNERTLLMCAWCKKALCYYHLIEDLHLHL